MGCNCGKPKCDGHCGVSPAVLQINNPSECVLFRKVEVPASMGTSVENPPKPGAYRNVLLYYNADGEAYLYSSDGMPTKVTGTTSNYEILTNKPKINGVELVGDKSLADIGVTDAIDNALENYTPTSEFAEVAFTGDYNDLENTPTPPVTHFYRPVGAGVDIPTPLFHNPDFSDQVTYQQFEDAVLSGPVQIFVAESGVTMTYSVGTVDIADIIVGSRMTFYVTRNTFREVFRWESSEDAPMYIGDAPYDIQSNWSEDDASSPDYIRNKPTIPTVNDATLTITRNGTSAGTFTANSANDTTIDISVPTATSDLTNNSGFITNTVNDLANYYTKTATDGLLDGKQDVLTAGAHIDITGTTISGIVDNANSFTSTNPLENDVISKALWHKDAMTPNGVSGIYIGTGTFQWGSNRSITIGRNAPTTSANPTDKNGTIEIGTTAYATGRYAIAMGSSNNPTEAEGENDIAIGRGNTTAGPGSADTPGANNIAIGQYVDIRGSDNIGVGNLVTSNNRSPSGSTYESKGFGSVAIGSHTFAWMGSVALGSWSSATEEGVVSVGNNYNTPEQAIKRRIIYMADGIADTDAVNVRQLNAAIAGVTPNNISSADWSALWQ